jgi:hypothetical protein
MNYELCRFTLSFPPWLAWLVGGLGTVVLLAGLWRLFHSNTSGKLSWGEKSISATNVAPLLLTCLGLALFGVGVAAIVASYHEPFGRWAGGWVSGIIGEQDMPVSTDMTDTPLADLASRLSPSALYVVRLSPAARPVAVTGTYREMYCGADLINRICRQEASRLSCDVDTVAKVIRVCARTDEQPCKDRSL